MKAAVFMGPESIEVKDVPTPECQAGEILVRISACAICGTDMRIYYHGQKNVKPPCIIGHEIAGTIEEVGGAVEGYEKGERVILVTPVGCGECRFCEAGMHNVCIKNRALGYDFDGGFAEFMIVPEVSVRQGSVLKMPEGLPFDEGAVVEPLSCCVNGQEFLQIQAGDSVAVFGAGPIGCMHVELARAQGAEKIIHVDVEQKRLDLSAERFSADVCVNAKEENVVERILEETAGLGADVSIVACGSHIAQQQSVDATGQRGRISFFAGLPKDKPTIEFNSNTIHYKEISVYGAYASNRSQYVKAMELVAAKKVDASKFITHKFPLDKIVEGIKTGKSGKGLKMVVEP